MVFYLILKALLRFAKEHWQMQNCWLRIPIDYESHSQTMFCSVMENIYYIICLFHSPSYSSMYTVEISRGYMNWSSIASDQMQKQIWESSYLLSSQTLQRSADLKNSATQLTIYILLLENSFHKCILILLTWNIFF